VYRGGGWKSEPKVCRAALRSSNVPAYRLDSLGFRVVAVPPEGGRFHSTSAQYAKDFQLGLTRVAIDHVDTKDPSGELDETTLYLSAIVNARELALVEHLDGEELSCPAYLVVKFLRPARYRLSMTCRAERGNHKIHVHSPRSESFSSRVLTDFEVPRAFSLEFDAADSPYLLVNGYHDSGSLFVDSLRVEEAGDD
jgi:hypothetical protein